MGETRAVVKIVAIIGAILSSIFGLWCVGVAFLGGTIPIIGWDLKGGLFSGLFFLIFVEPIIMTVGYWVFLLISLPLQLLFGSRK